MNSGLNDLITKDDVSSNQSIYAAIYDSLSKIYYYDVQFEENILTPIDEDMRVRALPAVNQACLALFSQGCSDFRVICLYLYASSLWLTRSGITEFFSLLSCLLKNHEKDIFPEDFPSNEYKNQIDNNLALLFKRINRKLDFQNIKKGQELKRLIVELDKESLAVLLGEIHQFSQWLEHYFKAIRSESIESVRMFQEKISLLDVVNPILEKDYDQLNEMHDELNNPIVKVSSAVIHREGHGVKSESKPFRYENASYALRALLKKIRVFQDMIHQKDYLKAVIVKQDVAQIIQNFDPTKYFPEIFGQFIKVQIPHGEPLLEAEMYLSQQQGMEALHELYRMDLEAFIEFDLQEKLPE